MEIDTGLHYPIKISEIPKSWSAVFVGDIASEMESGFACGKHSESDIGVVHIRPYNISRKGNFDFGQLKYVPLDHSEKRLQKGDVLFNNTNSPELIGKTAIVPSQGEGLAFSNHMTRISASSDFLPEFVAHQLQYLWLARYFLHGCVKHVNQASISTTDLGRKIPFVCAPLNEQRRIVAKIEALFAQVDRGVESLRGARARLGLYRQSVLKHAFEGKLTADWRAANPDKLEDPETLLTRIQQERDTRYKQALEDWEAAVEVWRGMGESGKKPGKPKRFPDPTGNVNFPEEIHPIKPDEWLWLSVGDIAEVTGGLTKNQKRNSLPTKVKYLRVANVYSNRFELDEIQEIGITDAEYIKTRLKTGDILIVEGNGSVEQIGRMAIWRDQIKEVSHQNHLIRARMLNSFIPQFVLMFFMSPWGRKLVVSKANSTSGLHTLSISKVSVLPCPVPHIAEQTEIVRRLEAKLSTIDALEAEIDTQLKRADALRQSILKRAFSGKLVPQDPTDEPASTLLARIRAERESAPKPKRKRKAESNAS